jgi:hypothetical protein
MLDFIDYNNATQLLERGHWLSQPRDARRIFQIEVIDRIAGYDSASQCGLPALARPDKRDHAAALQCAAYACV